MVTTLDFPNSNGVLSSSCELNAPLGYLNAQGVGKSFANSMASFMVLLLDGAKIVIFGMARKKEMSKTP